jgi:predicted transposase/invertase (TIGR01784 family)
MLATKNTYIQSAYKTLQVISQDDQKRMEYEAREKAIRDYNQGMLEAEERGREEGIKEGEQRGREEGILGMISAFRDFGHSDAEIKTALIKNYNLSGNDAQRFLSETK